jgi:predicted dehydrogenase
MKKNKTLKNSVTPVIIIGTGHHFQRNLTPATRRLKDEGLIKMLATVDILNRGEVGHFEKVRHIKRNNKPLHNQLKEFKKEDPLVILGHTNSLHAGDALDLLSHGFRVAIEKPYALTSKSLHKFLKVGKKNRCSLLEYYLFTKSVALLLGFGELNMKSFYLNEWLIKPYPALSDYAHSVDGFANKLPDIIGRINKIEIDVLEGQGETGTLEGRGIDTLDIKYGGGMIQDMATHVLAPLLSLEKVIGHFPDKGGFNVRTAYSKEYLNMVKRRFALPSWQAGETYADISFVTDKKIGVRVRFGKYVFGDRNRRGIIIHGSKGEAYLDMDDCTLYVNGKPVLGIDKSYYPVVRAAIAETEGEPLFNFNAVKVLAKAQDMIFDIQKIARKNKKRVYYKSGVDPDNIFGNKQVDGLNEEHIRPEENYNKWLQLIEKDLHIFFPVKKRIEVACPGCLSSEVESEFVKLGFIYKWCKNCFSLYVSPRPSEDDIDEFYRYSKSMKFYGDRVFRLSLDTRYEYQIQPISKWLESLISQDATKTIDILDFMPKFYSAWAEHPKDSKRNIWMVDPVHLVKKPIPSKLIRFKDALKRQFDVITAFDVLDHRADPATTIKYFSKMCAKDGILLLTFNSSSGFEYQILGRDSHRLVPPTKFNLLTTEMMERLLLKNNFELINLSTPGMLDVDIVLKKLEEDNLVPIPRFISYILKKRGPSAMASLQKFLQTNNLSSFTVVAARKK